MPVSSPSVSSNYCRHCARATESATETVEVGGVRYEVSYCSDCGIASGAFRLTKDGKSKTDIPDNILLRKMHAPDRKRPSK